jgi:NADP-dependent 3-hydroxy acid dehydrogenase YdfG
MGAMQKRVLITGGEGGLAMACKDEFSSNGWDVLAPNRTELDVTYTESVDAYFADCGDIDLLICAAGTTDDQLLSRLSEEKWDHVLDVNVKGAFRCARAVSRQMLRRRSGHVLFIGSY